MASTHVTSITLALFAALAASTSAQGTGTRSLPDLTGTWEAETPDGPQQVIVRGDSTASFGDEIIHWSVTADTVFLAFGDEWIGYNYVLRGRTLTLSGGDLLDPQDLIRVGPPTPLPEGAVVPPAPRRPRDR